MKQFLLMVALTTWFAVQTAPATAEDLPPVQVAPLNKAISVADKKWDKKVELKIFRIGMKEGEPAGSRVHGWSCSNEAPLYYRLEKFNIMKGYADRMFNAAFDEAGYKLFEDSESAFGSKAGNGADLQIALTVKDYKLHTCENGNEVSGGMYLKIAWEVLSPRLQKVVFNKTTEGSYQMSARKTYHVLHDNAFKNAINNLLAMPEFVALMQAEVDAANAPAEAPAPKVTQSEFETLTLPAIQPPPGGTAKNSAQLQKAVVTIENSGKSGSGFYISKSGYLLTTSHVVQGAKYVRVRMGQFDFFPGEVVRIDPLRDVALIKTSSVDVQPLAMRQTGQQVAEEVYAIGSPLGKTFAGTMSKGILSATDRILESKIFLQSDVNVTNGSSGGPLLDSKGAVIGISQSGMPSNGNLNFFVPIGEALKKLGIEVK